MTPWEIAKPGTESAHQKALFAWAAMAERRGFKFAWQETTYTQTFRSDEPIPGFPVPELKWLFAIPNGGARNAITAGRMKAEGVKKGVADIFLPVLKVRTELISPNDFQYHSGLWIEMKVGKNKLSPEQDGFCDFVLRQGYRFALAYSWIYAAKFIETYLS